jgi:PTS system fructose-specific IIC component/PTS system nitrogen regulatory IIA component
MGLREVFLPKSISVSLESSDKDELFAEMTELILAAQPKAGRGEILAALEAREARSSTALGDGVALPRGVCPSVTGVVGAVGISRLGIDYGAPDEVPVRAVFMLLSNPASTGKLVEVVRLLAGLIEEKALLSSIIEGPGHGAAPGPSAAAVYDMHCRFEDGSVT